MMYTNRVTEDLTSYVYETEYDNLPPKVVSQAKTCILGCLGGALGGFGTKLSKTVTGLIKDMGGKPESTIIGNGTMVPCTHAMHACTSQLNMKKKVIK